MARVCRKAGSRSITSGTLRERFSEDLDLFLDPNAFDGVAGVAGMILVERIRSGDRKTTTDRTPARSVVVALGEISTSGIRTY